MKIAFLCSSLAPGRSAVGDYARQLSTSCTASGHSCRLIAVNDRHLPNDEAVVNKNGEIRFSSSLRWDYRAAALGKALEEYAPDWVSWQLSPSGLHPRGVIPTHSFQLVEATRKWKQHVMLHELWNGMARNDTWNARLTGSWQRGRLLAFLNRLKPASMHTSNAAYQRMLAQHGWHSSILPIFGNIAIEPCEREVAKSALERLVGSVLPPEPHLVAILFGTIHPQWSANTTFSWLSHAAELAGKRMVVLSVGRAGPEGELILARCAEEFPDVPSFQLGPRPAPVLSRLMQAADLGLSTHPWALIEKSGSTATLLEHGLPVLVARDDWQLRQHSDLPAPSDPLALKLVEHPPQKLSDLLLHRRAPASRCAAITHQFIAELGEPARRCAILN